MANYDVIIIGSGPGGYVCAIRCAQLGMKTAIIERYNTLGGTCLNVGCIPSKALLDSSEHYHNAAHHFKTHGIEISKLTVNLNQMIARKDEVVKKTCEGVAYLMKKNKIDVHYGHGSFVDKTTVAITNDKGEVTTITAPKIIIATGSKPSTLSGVEIDKKRVITSTEALKLPEIPKHLVVIGAGVIGLEMGSVYARLGSAVTVLEYSDRCISGMDAELGKEIQKILTKHLNFKFLFNHKVQKSEVKGKQVKVTALDKEDQTVTVEGDYCLVATGRRPYTDGLKLENAGLKTDERGRIPVDDHLQTAVPGIYAIGDVIRGAMLAHKASDEGVYLAERLAGLHTHIDYLKIPGVVYTWPEVAGVGYTEEDLKKNGTPYKVGKFPFMALGRARASMDTDGFIKVIAHKDTDEVLGVHMIGPRVADVIAEAVVAMEYRASAEDIGIFSHAHPTFTEALKEAALAATANRALHV